MYGQIPHRLPESPTGGDREAKEAAERASGSGIDVDGFDDDAVSEFRSDFVSPESEGGSGPASSSISENESLGSQAGSDVVTTEEERAGKAAEATTSAGEGEGEEERAATTPTTTTPAAAAAAADGASTSTSSSSTPPKPAAAPAPSPPRPSWPPPRRPKKTYSQLQLPSPEQMAQEEAMNNCGVRTVLSGVMGAGLGVVFGIFMGTMDMAGPQAGGPLPAPTATVPTVTATGATAAAAATTTTQTAAAAAAAQTATTGTAAPPPPPPPATPPPPPSPPKQSVREVLRATALSTKQRCVSYSKGFGAMGALFAGSECVIEKARAKHDIYNAVYAGCAAGGALAASGGIKAAGFGCVSFAAFSAFIEKVMQHD